MNNSSGLIAIATVNLLSLGTTTLNKNKSVTNVNSWIWKWLLRVVLQLFSIDHIHDSCHDGFHIIMQICHVVSQGANNAMMLFLQESALLSSELSVPKSPLRAKLWNNDFIVIRLV